MTTDFIVDHRARCVTDPATGQVLTFSPRRFEDAQFCQIDHPDGTRLWTFRVNESADACYAGRAVVFYPVQEVRAPSGPVPASDPLPFERLSLFLAAYRTHYVRAMDWVEPRIIDDRRPLQD